VRRDDVTMVRVHCSEPTGLQLDGDYVGAQCDVIFSTVAEAIHVMVQPKVR